MLQEICQKNHNSNILSYCESDLMYIEVQTKRHIVYTAKVAKIIYQHCIYYKSIKFCSLVFSLLSSHSGQLLREQNVRVMMTSALLKVVCS